MQNNAYYAFPRSPKPRRLADKRINLLVNDVIKRRYGLVRNIITKSSGQMV